jgi:hypothetical protein
VEVKNDYIEWMFRLEGLLREYKVEISDYDEFHINDAIITTENILKQYQSTTSSSYHIDDDMVDEYMKNAIKNNPSKKDYYETISYYVKKRFSCDSKNKF